MFHYFKEGDAVPQWLERTSDAILTFGVDVMVHQLEDVAHIFPLKEQFFACIKVQTVSPDRKVRIQGYPVVMHANFDDFFTGYENEKHTFETIEYKGDKESE